MKIFMWLLLLWALVPGAAAQDALPDLPVTPRVDTTEAEVRAVYALWRGYLAGPPDAVHDNPYWSAAEQAQRHAYDLTRKWTYGYEVIGIHGSVNLHQIYDIRPHVLSIDRAGDGYVIRTLYRPADPAFGTFTVQRVYARKERGAWRLFSAAPVMTRHWPRHRVGPVEFIVDPDHLFDRAKAAATAAYVDSLRATFGLHDEPPITFYLAATTEAMARAIGLDYTWDPTDGRAYPRDRLLVRGDASEWNPHEVAHAVFGAYDLAHVILEGLATYLGGSGERTFEQVAADLAQELSADATLPLDDVLRGKTNSVTLFYGTGAVLVDAVLERAGVEGLERFMEQSGTPDGVYEGLRDVLGLPQEAADAFWRTRARSYLVP